jgi:hypothetical protein
MSRASERNRRFGRKAPATPIRPERIKLKKGQTPVPSGSSITPLARITRDVATQGYGFKRHVLHDANVRIADYNEAMRRKHGRYFVPRPLINPTKTGPGRGTW